MKRILALLTAVLLVLCLPVLAEAEEEISITTRQQLEAIRENPSGNYRLDADIDLSEAPWVPIAFSGYLNGNGHTVYNLTVEAPGDFRAETIDGNRKLYDTVFAGLFSSAVDAEIRDLHILGADIQIETEENCYAAILAGYLMHSKIENCTVDGRVRLVHSNRVAGAGGMAGFGVGEIKNCHASAELTVADRRERGIYPRCEQFMGGLLACGNAMITDNTVEIHGFGSSLGYAHNGGLVGMHYCYDAADPWGKITGNHVDGSITFFENNTARRAYCSPFAGEVLPDSAKVQDNTQNFTQDERRGETREITPNPCENPIYTEQIVAHTDTDWGYTLHQFSTCSYSYKTDYMAPGHVLSDWEVIRDPDYGTEGSRVRRCALCGETVEEESIPALTPVSSCSFSEPAVKLRYKDSTQLSVTVTPAEAFNTGVTFESSDPEVAAVDENGTVTALSRGTATITCRSQDGFASSRCQVEITYSFPQWLIEIFLFGWLWY